MAFKISTTLLLVIDVQNDFCPAYTSASGEHYPQGALAVQDGGGVIAPLNSLAKAVAAAGGWVAATQDWHPARHSSFASAASAASAHAGTKEEGLILWPDHCVQGKWGAALHEKLDLRPVHLIIRKGFRPALDSYSAFFENDRKTPTGLGGWIRGLGIETVIIGGLATDYCVLYSAMDSNIMGLQTIIVEDAVRGVDYPPGSLEKAIRQMKNAGITFAGSAALLKELRQ